MNPMSAIAFVAERKIEEALADGAFDNLPGMGKPLELEDLSHLPPDMRMAYTILKNSGFVDKCPEPGKDLSMRDLLSSAEEERATYGKMQRLKVMMARVQRRKEDLALEKPAPDANTDASPYLEKLIAKI
jgi:hypothetical protein